MTADPVIGSYVPRGPETGRPDQAETGISRAARLVRESFAHVEKHETEMAQYFYGMLFALDPATREMFPANMEVQRSRLFRAVSHIVKLVDSPEELTPFLHQLGRDHRKFGVVAKEYDSLGIALLAAVKRYAGEAWTPEVEMAWAEAYAVAASAMQQAAAADENPAYWPAQVVGHQRLTRDLAVVTVRPDHGIPFAPGQYVSVETPQRPRLWRYLSPANAPRGDGTMEFHVRSVAGGWVSQAIVAHARIGDTWRIAAPMGRMRNYQQLQRDVLMVAGGTGLATMRSLLEDVMGRANPPRVHLFYGARESAELYDLPTLRRLTRQYPWLTVVPVAESVSEVDDAREAEIGNLAEVVTRYGAWADREVFVAGSPGMIRGTVSRMLVAGTPLDQVHYDPFTIE
jgi:NAD(P)H-flavin reductase